MTRIAGVDLGDRSSVVRIIDGASGDVLERATIPTTPTTRSSFGKYFARQQRMRVALETGTHSPWASRLVSDRGHEVITANARQLLIVYGARNKSDELDSKKLARLARLDVRLLVSVQHRGEAAQRDLARIRSRGALAGSRTLLIKHACGSVKAFAHRLPKCAVDAFHKVAWPFVPADLGTALGAVFDSIKTISEQIRVLDGETDRLTSDA